MEGHATVPDLERTDGTAQDGGEIIEENIAETATEDDAKRCPDDEIVELRP